MKCVFDLICSSLLVALFSPLYLLIALAIIIFQGFPVLFRQERLGLQGTSFTLLKFRTMAVGISRSSTHDQIRLTTLGRILRKASLDELPTLLNVIMGHMSLVGPRPLLKKYITKYNSFQARRHEVKPGITGLAQIKGRNTLSWEEKFNYDVYYVDNNNLLLDIQILFLTLVQIFSTKGVSPENQEIMPEFLGTNKNGTIKKD